MLPDWIANHLGRVANKPEMSARLAFTWDFLVTLLPVNMPALLGFVRKPYTFW